MSGATAQARALEFAGRVMRCGVLVGLETLAFWPKQGTLEIRVRHPYGPWRCVVVHGIANGLAHSEGGSPVTPADVAVRLRNALRDRPADRRIGRRWALERAERAAVVEPI